MLYCIHVTPRFLCFLTREVIFALVFKIYSTLQLLRGIFMTKSAKIGPNSKKILFFGKKWNFDDVNCHVFYPENDSICCTLSRYYLNYSKISEFLKQTLTSLGHGIPHLSVGK